MKEAVFCNFELAFLPCRVHPPLSPYSVRREGSLESRVQGSILRTKKQTLKRRRMHVKQSPYDVLFSI